jgi:hypothetical protein
MGRQVTSSPPRASLVPIDVITDGLAARDRELCTQLFPHGVIEGHEYCVGSLAGEPGRSLKIHLGGGRSGVWCDFATGETGDALDLVAQAMFRGDKRQALAWSRSWLGLGDAVDDHSLALARRQAEASKARAKADAEAEANKNRGNAFRLWLAATPTIRGTPVERYLLGRAIDLAQLGRQPRALRYHPALANRESGRRWPAMVAMIVNGLGQTIAVHRTWLEARPDGTVGKAPLKEPKMTLGAYRGGAIRLWRGASGKSLVDAPAGELVELTEGIEDGLSVAIALPECRVLVAVALANMAHIDLPPAINGVRIWRQNDPPNSKAAQALDRAIEAHLAAGRSVQVVDIPAEFKDVNDLLRRIPAPRHA